MFTTPARIGRPLSILYALALTPFSLAIAGGDAGPTVSFEDASGLLEFERGSLPFGGSGLAGAAWFDYDRDGLLDLFLTNGKTQPNGLLHNNGDGTFTNTSVAAGVANGLGNTGVVAADIDNDGYQDLLLIGDGGIMGSPQSPAVLYLNNGDGTFTDITADTGIVSPETALSAAFGDIDNDGFLDLFITAPGSLVTQTQHRNMLYRNNGDLTFTDISVSAGIDTMLGACIVFMRDHDSDGLIDIFVGNCNDVFFQPTPIELFRNNGDLTFTDIAARTGLGGGGFWMGFGPGDYDNDGDIDIFVTNLGTSVPALFRHALYRNNGNGTYSNVALTAGAALHEFGWGCTFQDFDNDGWADIFFAGSLPLAPFNLIGPGLGNPGTLLMNDQDGTFANLTSTLPVNLSSDYTSGVAAGDYDNDGFVDIVVAIEPWGAQPGTPALLRNQRNENNWMGLRLVGSVSNRDAVGAQVRVTAGALTQTREVYAGTSFLSMDSQWLTFGLATQSATDAISVRWPTGRTEAFLNVPAGVYWTLIEGQGLPDCPPDLDANGFISTMDLLTILAQWGDDPGGPPDFNGDGIVERRDLEFLLVNWGPCP